LVLLNWQGHVSVVVGVRPADLEIRNSQLAALRNGRGFKLSVALIRAKIRSSQRTLNSLPITPAIEATISDLEAILEELNREITGLDALRFIEARAAAVYFRAWRKIPVNWKWTNRHVIPQQWLSVGQRESFFSKTNRHPTHPVNALLNYAYRMLESQVQIAAVSSGLDPTIGFLHANRQGRAALVYDLMEPLRPEVDRSILRFVTSNTFTPKDFLLGQKGVCRLHPLLARRVVGLTSHQAAEEVVTKAAAYLQLAS
jgi:CRISPR-associated endonuclease Cas1